MSKRFEGIYKASASFLPQRRPKLGETGRPLLQACRKALLHSVPCEWYVGKAIPRQGQRLQDAEDEGEPLVVPPKGRTQGERETQQHHDGGDQACGLHHSPQLFHGPHEEDSAPDRSDVTKGIKHGEEVQPLPRHPEQKRAQQRAENSCNKTRNEAFDSGIPAQ